MNLLDEVEVPKQPIRASLTKAATRLANRRPTRRGKKKPRKSAKWRKEYARALKNQIELKKQFTRNIDDE